MTTEASEVSVCNAALLRLGEVRISSLEDTTELARMCAALLPGVRRYVLAQYPWSCALDRQTLARRAEAPAFGWSYAYALPADCLRPLSLEEEKRGNGGYPWRWEGDSILTNAETASLSYVFDLADYGKMEEGVLSVISARLAWILSYRITHKGNVIERMAKELRQAEAEAGIIDATSDTTTIVGGPGDSGEPLVPGKSWVQARRG